MSSNARVSIGFVVGLPFIFPFQFGDVVTTSDLAHARMRIVGVDVVRGIITFEPMPRPKRGQKLRGKARRRVRRGEGL